MFAYTPSCTPTRTLALHDALPIWSTDNEHHHGYLQRTAVMNIYRTTSQERTERASQEAAEWRHVMNAEPSADEREAFAAWVAARSEEHTSELQSRLERVCRHRGER